MFCPKCEKEYPSGLHQCADCGVDLIEGRPPETGNDAVYVDLVEIFSTYNQGDIAVIKSVLDGEEIHYYFQGESSNMMIAAGSYARLLVRADEADRAREILREFGFLDK